VRALCQIGRQEGREANYVILQDTHAQTERSDKEVAKENVETQPRGA
jgi:hypothetical protein